jgi:hypothetical protein
VNHLAEYATGQGRPGGMSCPAVPVSLPSLSLVQIQCMPFDCLLAIAGGGCCIATHAPGVPSETGGD